MAKAQTVNEVSVMQVDPGILLADDNSRFALKPSRIESMMDDVLKNGFIQPLEVTELPKPQNGALYRVTDGHYRQAAAVKLKESNPQIKVPIIVRESDPADRLKRQIAANVEREEMSPMDRAVAIKRLMDAGVSRIEVREIFKSAGGRKGAKVQPLSNAMLNILVSFLEFPKEIQRKLHTGELQLSSGYKLSRYPHEKWDAILADAESERAREEKQYEADEEKYLAEQRKAAEAVQKQEQAAKELEEAKTLAADKEEEAKRLLAEAEAAYATAKKTPAKDKEAKLAAEKAFKEADEKAKAIEREMTEAHTKVTKLETKAKTAIEQAEERRVKLEEARRGLAAKPANKKTGPTAQQIDKAAVRQGASTNYVALNAQQMRQVIQDWATLPGSNPKVQLIGQIISRCFQGIITDKQAYSELAYSVTGELKEKPKHVGKAK